MDKTKTVRIKNRSSGMVIYSIPEMNIRREYAPNEEKKVSYEELEKLTYLPGGQALLNQYLQITDEEVIDELNIPTQPEYFMSAEQVKDLLLNGSMDAFMDCLDYAPQGVLDLVKDLAVKLPVQDTAKRIAIKDKLGFDCSAAIRHVEELTIESSKENNTATKTQTPGRRTSGSQYKPSKYKRI